MIEQAKFTYSPWGKTFVSKIISVESQGEEQIKAFEEHGKQLVKSNERIKKYYCDTEQYSPSLVKQKEILN